MDERNDGGLNDGDASVNPYQSPAEPRAAWRGGRISWSVFAVLVAIVVSLGVLAALLPVMGVPLVVVAIPAAVRASWMCYRRAFHVANVNADFAIKSFSASLGIGTLVIVSAAICFTVVCFPIGFVAFTVSYPNLPLLGTGLSVLAFGFGAVAGGFGIYAAARKRWSRGVDPLPEYGYNTDPPTTSIELATPADQEGIVQ